VAELPWFDDGTYTASVRVAEPVAALFINKNDFRRSAVKIPTSL
jgi:hypothetical protein